MLKKFFSIALLLTVCAVNADAPAAKPAVVAAAPAVTASAAATPAADVKKSVEAAAPATATCTESTFCKAKNAVCAAFETAKNAVVGHPYISATVAAVAVAGVAYNQSETVKGWFGVSDDASKCPCTKRDGLEA